MDNKIPHILIVDDDANLLGTMRDVLIMKGFEPVIAPTGAAALAQLELHHFDLALVDLRLGDMSGLIVLRAIKTHSPETECILLTGHASQDTAIEAIQMGAYGYFQKPFDMEQVLLSIQRALEKKQSAQALRNSEQRFRALIENGRDNISLLAADGTLLWESPSTKSTLGYVPDQFVGRNIFELLHPDDRVLIQELFAQLVHSPGKSQDGIFRLQHGDGTWRWIESTTTNMLNEPSVQAIVINYRDISERKLAEESREAGLMRERFLASLIQDASVAIGVGYPDGRLGMCNLAFQKLTGYSEEELKNINWNTALTPPEWMESESQSLAELHRTKQSVIYEKEYIHKSGKRTPIELVVHPLCDADGNISHYYAFITDITERKQAEEKVRKSEALFASLFHANPTRISITRFDDSRFIDVNETFLKSVGYTREEVVGRTSSELNDWVDQQDRIRLRDLLEKKGRIKDFETQLRRKSGEIMDILISAELIELFDETCILSVGLDITERKQAEEKIRVLSRAMEQSPASVVITDLQGAIEYVNPKFSQVTGYSLEEIIGENPNILKSGNTTEAEYKKLWDTIMSGNVWRGEFLNKKKNGETYWENATIAPVFNDDGEITNFLAVKEDITERKQAEENYRSIFENALEGIFQSLPQGRFTAVNPAFAHMLGYESPDELVETVTDIASQIYVESPLRDEFVRKLTEQGTITRFEFKMKRKDGGIIWVSESARSVYDDKGKLRYYEGSAEDITERKQAEQRLQESEKRYRTIFDGVQDAIFIETKDGNILEVNKSACEMYGYKRDEFLTKTVADFVLEGNTVFAPHLTLNKSSAPIETINRRANGEIFPIEISGGVQVINGEEVLLAIVRDITERKKAEEALQESEERFRVIFEKANDAIHIEDANDKILAVNSRMCELMGYSREELLKMRVADLQAPERRQLGGVISREFTRHNSTVFEALNLHHDGRRIPVEISIGLIERPSGNLYISVVRDITERKQAERNIRQRVRELELLYQSGLVFSQMLNPKQIAQKIITLLGEKLDWHHTTIRLIRGQDELELLAFDQPGLEDKAAQAVESRFKNSISRVGEGLSGWALQQSKTIRLGDVNSDPHYVATYPGLHSGLYVPLKSGNRMVGVISIESEQPDAFSEADEQLLSTLANQAANAFENARLFQTAQQEIIERKRVEDLLAEERNQLTQRVEERTSDLSRVNLDLAHAVQVKDEFLASMSHELRTPLTGILGLSEVLQLRVYGELNDKQSSTLKTIEESGRHLLDLINDILDLSKIEAGKLELQFAPCSLADICLASLQLIKGMAQHKSQHVHYSPPPEPIIVRADARRLKQLLVNLLSNAIKFTPENGELGLEVEAIQSERKIKLTVWDKGIGIKPDDLNDIFKPFVQLDSGLAREYSGTGLGLSLVQHLTELHNGGIEVESNIGEGSRFTIILPWSPQNTTPIPYVQHRDTGRLVMPPAHFKAPLVMVVDDNETILQIVSDFLEAKQYRVITVRSGLELLERAAEHHPNIMLVDIQMPGIGGLETIRRIRAHADPFVAAAPVIAVTALAMPADREHCLRAGANDYMSKPLKLKALAIAIQSLLERKQ